MRLLAPLLLSLTAAAQPAQPPAEQTWLAPDTEARWVPFTLTSANQIRFTVSLDGTPVAAILDTGVSHTALSRRYAVAARLQPDPGPVAEAIGGIAAVGWLASPTLAFGGLSHRGGRIAVVTLPEAATGGDRADLLVGRDLLASFALEIDYDASRFRLLPSGRVPFAGMSLPLTIGGAAPAYVSTVPVDGMPARMIVDSGDGNAVTLGAGAWLQMGAMVPVTSTLSYGVGGRAVTDLAVLSSLELGPLHAGATEVAIESEGGYSQMAGASGRIGTGLLRRYHVLLDPTAGHMILTPGSQIAVPPVRSTSGLLMVRESGALRILHVMRGSPATETGWQAGDTICSVDGTSVAAVPADAPIAWPIGKPGRTLALGLCDGRVRTLTLRAFY